MAEVGRIVALPAFPRRYISSLPSIPPPGKNFFDRRPLRRIGNAGFVPGGGDVAEHARIILTLRVVAEGLGGFEGQETAGEDTESFRRQVGHGGITAFPFVMPVALDDVPGHTINRGA